LGNVRRATTCLANVPQSFQRVGSRVSIANSEGVTSGVVKAPWRALTLWLLPIR